MSSRAESSHEFVRRIRGVPVNSACMLVLAASLLACAPRGSLGEDLPDDTSQGTGTTADPSTDETGSSTTGVDASTGATDSVGSTGPDGDSSSTAGELCPPLPEDDACTVCTKGHCCDVRLACDADEICLCIETCIADGGDPVACEQTHCAGPNDAWIHLHDCVAMQCADAC